MRDLKKIKTNTFRGAFLCAFAGCALFSSLSLANNNAIREEVSASTVQQSFSATPIENISTKEVFRSGMSDPRSIIEKKQAEKKLPKESFLYPSPAFIEHLEKYFIRANDIVFLQDNLATLFERHPDCRRIESYKEDPHTAKVACSKVENFLSEGDEVILTYARANEVLTGGIWHFNSYPRALSFEKRLLNSLPPEMTFQKSFGEFSRITEAPMATISIQPAKPGFLVILNTLHTDRLADIENHMKFKAKTLEFGENSIGKTTLEEFNSLVKELPKSCTEVTSKLSNGFSREFYGVCFGFPYESHMQFEFNPLTNILKTVVLSPIGISSGTIVEDMLTSKYGDPTYCRRIKTDVRTLSIKQEQQKGRLRVQNLNNKASNVFAGTCDKPIVFSSDMRFIFDNSLLNESEIMTLWSEKKNNAVGDVESQTAFDEKKEKVKGFFD